MINKKNNNKTLNIKYIYFYFYQAKREETAALEADARQDLEAAMPALLEAQKALEALDKRDINEVRVFIQPPHLVRFVMEAVNLLLGEK